MIVSLIAAVDEDRGIARQGHIPWHLRSDLLRFKALTMGHHILMGRKTCESIGRPLPGRTNVVISRQRTYQANGCVVVHSLEDALNLARANGETEAFIIGGGEIYSRALPVAGRIYLTRVHTRAGCDVFFPELVVGEWRLVTEENWPLSEQDEFPAIYQVYDRRAPADA